MPFRMGGYTPAGATGRLPNSDDLDEDMWNQRQQQTQSDVSAALERAKNRRGEDSESGRRSRSTSESSTEHTGAGKHSRHTPDSREKKNPVPPRFLQQHSGGRPSDRVDGDERMRDYPPRSSQWPMGPWPHMPPHPFMPGMALPPPPPISSAAGRPRNNSHGSDDGRRTPDDATFNQQQLYGHLRFLLVDLFFCGILLLCCCIYFRDEYAPLVFSD